MSRWTGLRGLSGRRHAKRANGRSPGGGRLRSAAIAACESLEERIVFGNVPHGTIGNKPPPTAPDCGCGCNDGTCVASGPNQGNGPSSGTGGGKGTTAPSKSTPNPVREFDGLPEVSASDLRSDGFGFAWGQTRSWTGTNNASLNGNGWTVKELPFVIFAGGSDFDGPWTTGTLQDDRLEVVSGGTAVYTFTVGFSYGSYASWGGERATLDHVLVGSTYVLRLTDDAGNVTEFYDVKRNSVNGPIDSPLSDLAHNYGKFKSFTSADGSTTVTASYDSGGYLTTVTRGDTNTSAKERYSYTYAAVTNDLVTAASDTPPSLIDKVTLERSSDSGSTWHPVRRASYEYYTGRVSNGAGGYADDPNGRLGDLKFVTVQQPQDPAATPLVWQDVDKTYYRYYKFTGDGGTPADGPTNKATTTGGPAPLRTQGTYNAASPQMTDTVVMSGLKTVIEGAALDRLAAALPGYASATDAQIEPYVSNYFEYERWGDHVGTDGYPTFGANSYDNNRDYLWRLAYRLSSRYRVTKEIAGGVGCSLCTDGMGTSKLEYAPNYLASFNGPSGAEDSGLGYHTLEYNVWRMRTTEYVPDSTPDDWGDNDRNVTYMNELGQPMVEEFVDVNSSTTRSATAISYSRAGGGSTLTFTLANHNFFGGETVSVSGVLPQLFNGLYTVTVIDQDTFSVTVPTNLLGYTGQYSGYIDSPTPFGSDITVSLVSNVTRTFYKYDDQGRLVLVAQPSAVTGLSEDSPDLMNTPASPGGNYEHIDDSAGLLDLYAYGASTTATTSTAGDVTGYRKSYSVRHGETGSDVKQADWTYLAHADTAGVNVYVTATESLYANTNGTGAQTTRYGYGWYSGTNRVKSVTTTLPPVTEGDNGRASSSTDTAHADTSSEFHDRYGRVIWVQDGDGYVHYTQYDDGTGAVVKTITDVKYSSLTLGEQASFGDTGWTQPSSGVQAVTSAEVDGLGRTTKFTDANGNVTYTVYRDALHEVRTYPGWNATTHLPTGPTTVVREDRVRKYTETLTMSVAPALDGSNLPTGAEAISGVQSLRRDYVNDAGQVIQSDVYDTLDAGYSVERPYAAEVLADAPRGYWRLGDSAGSTTFADLSGNAYTGSYTGTVGTGSGGALSGDDDRSAQFSSSGYGLVPDTANLRISNSFTVELWVKLDSTSQTQRYLLSRNDASGTYQAAVIYGYVAGKVEFVAGSYTGSDPRTGSQISIGDTNWHHVAYTYDGTTWAGYLDGSQVFSTTRTFALSTAALDGWYVGAANASTSFANVAGQLDEVAIYGNALSADRVAAHYEAATGQARGVDRTELAYEAGARLKRVKSPTGTITRYVYDGQGRNLSTWVGTDDAPTSGYWSPTNTAGTDLVKVGENSYDVDSNLTSVAEFTSDSSYHFNQMWYDWRDRLVASGQGGLLLTYYDLDNLGRSVTEYHYGGSGLSADDANSDGVPDQPSSGSLRAKTATSYDEQGRAFRTITYSVNPSSGAVGNGLQTDVWFDKRGNVIKTRQPGGLVYKSQFDGAGRETKRFVSDGGGDPAPGTTGNWDAADDVSGDKVLEQVETQYTANGLPLLVTTKQRFHDETATGELVDAGTAPKARVSYVDHYYDSANRPTKVVNVGTNGGTAYARPIGSDPTRSNTVLITDYGYLADEVQRVSLTGSPTGGTFTLSFGGYTTSALAYNASGATVQSALEGLTGIGSGNVKVLNVSAGVWLVRFVGSKGGKSVAQITASGSGLTGGTAPGVAVQTDSEGGDTGRVQTATDPRAIVTATDYDLLGRTLRTTEAYTDFNPGFSDDRITEYTYDGMDHVLTMRAVTPDGSDSDSLPDLQTTQYVYGVTSGGGSNITSDDLLTEVRFPDKTTGNAGTTAADKRTYTYNALGQVKTYTDQNGSVHTYTYDGLGRLTVDEITTLGSGVDGAIRKLTYTYDTAGRPATYKSLNASGTEISGVTLSYNGFGQVTQESQSHATQGTASVSYAYSETDSGASNHSRLTSITYPNGRVVTYDYGTSAGLNDTISRVAAIKDGSTTLEGYSYLGLGTVVERDRPQPGTRLSYVQGGTTGDAGDQYVGLDRFSRVVDQRWYKVSTSADFDRFKYGYDADSNVMYKEYALTGAGANSELYHATGGGYDQLNRLVAFKRGTLNTNKDDVTGTPSVNRTWTLDALGNWSSTSDEAQARGHNRRNQLTSRTGSSLSYDNNGNLTTDERGYTFKYDAWDRLVEVKNASSTTVAAYEYDAQGRRIVETVGGTTRRFYYSSGWQVLEERVGGNTKAQYVWGLGYTDQLVERDDDADGNSANGAERRLYAQQDANHNVTSLTDTSGTVQERYGYAPYGTFLITDAAGTPRSSSSYSWTYLFQGRPYESATDLYDFRGRRYRAQLGRFTQADHGGYIDGMSLYQFVRGNPQTWGDPFGFAADGPYDFPILEPFPQKPKPKPKPKLEDILSSAGLDDTCIGKFADDLPQWLKDLIAKQLAQQFKPAAKPKPPVLNGTVWPPDGPPYPQTDDNTPNFVPTPKPASGFGFLSGSAPEVNGGSGQYGLIMYDKPLGQGFTLQVGGGAAIQPYKPVQPKPFEIPKPGQMEGVSLGSDLLNDVLNGMAPIDPVFGGGLFWQNKPGPKDPKVTAGIQFYLDCANGAPVVAKLGVEIKF